MGILRFLWGDGLFVVAFFSYTSRWPCVLQAHGNMLEVRPVQPTTLAVNISLCSTTNVHTHTTVSLPRRKESFV